MLIDFECLTLEITRRCGMKCEHCMRGDAQDEVMYLDVIETICRKTGTIEHLNITGGEPSMVPDTIRYLLYYLKNNNCKVGAFFCATNAQKYSKDFAVALTELFNYCDRPQNCMLTISTDQFHSAADSVALKEYRKLPFYNPINEKGYIPESNILDEGRARDNGIGKFSPPYSTSLYDIDMASGHLKVGDRVYINTFGNVLLDADMSYATQDEEAIGNILSQSLVEIIMTNTFIVPENWFTPPGKAVYCLHLTTDEDIFVKGKYEDNRYFSTAREASAVFHRIIHNIHMTPINPELGEIPDELKLISENLPQSSPRCIGKKIIYAVPGEDNPKSVTLEVLRCPLEENIDANGK